MVENNFKFFLTEALADMRALTLSRPDRNAAQVLGLDSAVLRAEGRRYANSRGEILLQLAFYTADHKAHHVNSAFDSAADKLSELLESAFAQLNIASEHGVFEAKRSKNGALIITKKNSQHDDLSSAQPVESHNREKKLIIPEGESSGFLTALGLADASGRVYDKKRAKFRQINRFLEYISDITSCLPAKEELYALDLCCGKSYLTFAAYYYLTQVLGRKVKLIGIDLKPDVIAYCAETAESLGYSGLNFKCGDISAFEPERTPDLVLSLHACDIATDIVLAKAVSSGARVILSTPCCQHELYNQFDPSGTPLDGLCAQPLIRHKLTDAFTDALRALYLESCGYEVNAVELIDPEETPKNTLLRAIKKRAENSGARIQYEETCKFLGVKPSRLK